jgi:hypothetical protein
MTAHYPAAVKRGLGGPYLKTETIAHDGYDFI